MKVTNNERFVFGILEIGMVVRDTLEYFVPNPEGYDVNRYQARKAILKNLTAENSPFYSFCAQNGLGNVKDDKGNEVPNKGQKLLNNIADFTSTVYGDDSRFIRLIDGKLVVDPSYFVPVLEQIIGIRETMNDVLKVVMASIKENRPEDLDPQFSELITIEERYARAIELRVTSMQLNTTFLRFNRAVQNYINTLRTSTSLDPLKDPNFKPTDDPEVAFDNNEMGKLFGFLNFLITHSHETDEEFKNACEKVKTLSRSFAGDPKITNIDEFMKEFAGVFINIIKETGAKVTPLFQDAFTSIQQYEQTLRGVKPEESAPAPKVEPSSDFEKIAQALSKDQVATEKVDTGANQSEEKKPESK